jgi:hypothetical protein
MLPMSSISCSKTFADIAEILPKHRDLSIPELITSTVKEPLRHSIGRTGKYELAHRRHNAWFAEGARGHRSHMMSISAWLG